MAPDPTAYVATPYGRTAGGLAVFRVVSDGLAIMYVTAPYGRSDAASVDATIQHTLAALAQPPKPVR